MNPLNLTSTGKILLIGQNNPVAQAIAQWLKPYGETTLLDNYQNLSGLTDKGLWNVAILDGESLGVNVFNVINSIKLIHPRTEILIILPFEKNDFTTQIINLLSARILFKPIEEEALVSTTINLIQNSREERRKRERKVILAVGAHPDDVEIACGGTLALLHQEGHQVHILTLSLGESGGDKETRKLEAQQAAEVLHAKLFLAELYDTHISEGTDTIHTIQKVVDQIQPTHVYTHSQHDNHQDHRNAHHATMVACRNLPNVFCYQSPSATNDFRPTRFINIANEIEYKIKSLACYQSQMQKRPYLKEEFIRSTALYWGRFANFSMAEPMEIVREQ